jgi:type I restriction enzyme, S subunit
MSWKHETFSNLLSESKIPCNNPDTNRRIRVKLNVKGVEKRPETNDKKGATNQYIRKAGQFIYGKQNFHKGAFGIIPADLDGYETSADIPSFDIREDCLSEWIYYFFKAGNRYLELEKYARGVGSKRIHPKQIAELKIPLPPIEIQKKIIGRLKTLEKNGISPELTHQLDLVNDLRQSFLREAMQGKLVEKNPDDEPASVLLKKIKTEKERLVREKKIRKGKLQEAETLEELLFEIPEHWEWCKLDDICKNITDGTHQTPNYTKTGRMFLSAQNVKPFRFMPKRHKFVSEEAYQSYIKNRKPERGDILIGRVGAGIGETAVIDQDIDFCIYVSLGLVQPFKDYVDSNYLTYVFNSPYGYGYAKGNISSKGGSAGNFNLGRIRSFLIPLPPLSEQLRIVTKLDELMAHCEDLEQSVTVSQKNNEMLLQQVLREALEPKQ